MIPHCVDNLLTDGGEAVSPMRQEDFLALEGLGKLKNAAISQGNQTRDLPICSTVPQPTTLPLSAANSFKSRRSKIYASHYLNSN
jgi:hypothetical protein